MGCHVIDIYYEQSAVQGEAGYASRGENKTDESPMHLTRIRGGAWLKISPPLRPPLTRVPTPMLVSAGGQKEKEWERLILVSMSIEGLFTTNICHSHSLCIAMNSFFRMAMGSTPNCFSSSMVSAKKACMCIGWWISCRMNPDKDLPLACQACRIRLQRCDLDRMCSQDLCQTPDEAIRPGSSLPSFNSQMIKRL